MRIIFNDKSYLLQWGMGALEIYCDMMDCDLDGLSMIEDYSKPLQAQKAIVSLITAALKNGCEVEDLEFDISLPKLKAYLDELPQSKFTEIMDDFSNSKYLGKTVREHLYGSEPDATQPKKKTNRSKSPKL